MKFTEIRKQVVAENETYCKNVLDAIKTREEILQRESTKTRWTQYQNNEIAVKSWKRLQVNGSSASIGNKRRKS